MEGNEVKDRLVHAIGLMEERYNPQTRMLRSPFSSPGYHTTLKNTAFIHSTRDSLIYALGLLDTELPQYEQRAMDIIRQVISLQETNPEQATYGIWPWFYEEPLKQMNPPDWNWADFCGKSLVQSVVRHSHRIPNELRELVRNAVFHACESIMRRNMGPHYTNIAIMGTFVTLIAGEFFGQPRYLEYGLERLEGIAEYTRRLGTFEEYNSPTYMTVVLTDLSLMHKTTKVVRGMQLSEELLELGWRSVAEHFHAATMEWSGPHSRCYSSLLKENVQAFLQIATKGAVRYFPDDHMPFDIGLYGCGVQCPSQFIPLFVESGIRTVHEIYQKDGNDGYEKTATTWITPSYSLGTASKEVLWNQRRNLLAYLVNGESRTYVALRCLHDGYDYAAAVSTCVQQQQHVLCGVQFSTNGGDTHIGLDRIDGTIQASDLRIRFEIGGSLQKVKVRIRGRKATAAIGALEVTVMNVLMAFSGMEVTTPAGNWELYEEDDGRIGMDLVLYSGPRRIIDFNKLHEALALVAFAVSEPDSEMKEVEVVRDDEAVTAVWAPTGVPISLTFGMKPERVEALRGML
ncbi:hypothetical protein [Paenibacillus sp. FSL H7-0331]|uniref:hypothetical protein n=1 Tax=Paenibacillus sp. FSL H7-0331 TaxID=1920421 RepID=UPI00096C1232|nr:hypothetical protein [Paenibacillus sp. FSL H7-0331]OMF08804.1 hypothetical protein BK127_28100 [Paenibacillus sp. FSL H7-0331]